jgi:MAC/Perforin domain
MILGSRMGMMFTMPPEQMQQNKGDRVQPRWRDEEIELAAKITAQFIKGVINTQILPRNQSSKAFTDLTKVAVNTFMIEVGPQPTEASQRVWAADTEVDPMPVKYKLGGIIELMEEGKGEMGQLEDREKLIKNMK